jgi:hypothetical protein
MKKPLRVTMCVSEPSDVELRAQETIQLDRLAVTDAGDCDVERHGALIRPGVTALRLDPGVYHFRSMTDAALRVVRGGVVATVINGDPKDPWPPPPPPSGTSAHVGAPGGNAHVIAFVGKGDDPVGESPTLTVTYA